MSSYFVGNDGIQTQISSDLFDVMWNSIEENEEQEVKSQKDKKKEHNDRLNKLNRENGYFKKYFKENDKSFECDRCGCIISSSTNKSKHMKTNKCKMLYKERQEREMEDKIIRKILYGN